MKDLIYNKIVGYSYYIELCESFDLVFYGKGFHRRDIMWATIKRDFWIKIYDTLFDGALGGD